MTGQMCQCCRDGRMTALDLYVLGLAGIVSYHTKKWTHAALILGAYGLASHSMAADDGKETTEHYDGAAAAPEAEMTTGPDVCTPRRNYLRLYPTLQSVQGPPCGGPAYMNRTMLERMLQPEPPQRVQQRFSQKQWERRMLYGN